MKTDYSTVVFSDEYRIILDKSDDLTQDWVVDKYNQSLQLRRDPYQNRIIFWARTIGIKIHQSFKVDDGIKGNVDEAFTIKKCKRAHWLQKISRRLHE